MNPPKKLWNIGLFAVFIKWGSIKASVGRLGFRNWLKTAVFETSGLQARNAFGTLCVVVSRFFESVAKNGGVMVFAIEPEMSQTMSCGAGRYL